VKDCNIHIAIVDPSHIISEGLSNILLKSDHHFQIYKFDTLEEVLSFRENDKINIVITSPSTLLSNEKDYKSVKKTLPKVKWVGIVYSFFDKKTIEQFDNVIEISESPPNINKIIYSVYEKKCDCKKGNKSNELSEREKDVLIELINGLSNKEIANKLFISTHTVASHRKNIVSKTGIKSLSGLTIYAITQKIISIE